MRSIANTAATTITCVFAALLTPAALACPSDAAPRSADTLLIVQGERLATRLLRAADFDALPKSQLTQRLQVSASAASQPTTDRSVTERSVTYGGVLLRDVLLSAGFGKADDRGARFTTAIETVATDGYRAYFSWGELFNSPAGEQIIVVTRQDDKALDTAAGPLALRAMADLRPGPRHVRNLCGVVVRR